MPLLKQLKPATNLLCDVHLMIDNPLDELPWFIDAGADLLNVHVEALDEADLKRAVAQIHEAGLLAAAALKPKTPASALSPVIAELDMALVMSVEPGFSGQSYIAGSDLKVAEVVQMARAAGNEELLIQVDGGHRAGHGAACGRRRGRCARLRQRRVQGRRPAGCHRRRERRGR